MTTRWGRLFICADRHQGGGKVLGVRPRRAATHPRMRGTKSDTTTTDLEGAGGFVVPALVGWWLRFDSVPGSFPVTPVVAGFLISAV